MECNARVTDIVCLKLINPVDRSIVVARVQCSLAADWTVPQVACVNLDHHDEDEETGYHSNIAGHSPYTSLADTSVISIDKVQQVD